MHSKRFNKPSEFAQQLRSKQKVRNIYRLMEKQFKGYVKKILHSKQEPYEALLHTLEGRLDNVVFRAGFAQSRDQARQIVGHGHILVNKRKINIPSYAVRIGDMIAIRDGSKGMTYFTALMPQWLKNYQAPEWILLDKDAFTATVQQYPTLDQSGIKAEDVQAIIEYYSR